MNFETSEITQQVAQTARDFAIQHRVSVRQAEFGARVRVALDAGIGRDLWVDNRRPRSRFDVETARTVA